jgi:DinB superfamily
MRDARTALPDRRLRECADRCRHRLGNITDAEWFWEPVPGCCSVRPRTEATTKFANGRGEWVVDYDLPEPDPAPFTTIGWRVLHLTLVIAGYLDVLDGYGGDVPWDEYEIPGTAQGGIAFWESQTQRLLATCSNADAETLDRSVSIPWWGGRQRAVRDVLLVLINESIHHTAEVGVLRDMYRWRVGQALAK